MKKSFYFPLLLLAGLFLFAPSLYAAGPYIDLRANNFKGTLTVVKGSPVTLTWSSNGRYCEGSWSQKSRQNPSGKYYMSEAVAGIYTLSCYSNGTSKVEQIIKVIPPSVTILSPKPFQKFHAGQTVNIRWKDIESSLVTSSNTSIGLNILVPNTIPYKNILATNLPYSKDGKYDFVIPTDTPLGQYDVYISSGTWAETPFMIGEGNPSKYGYVVYLDPNSPGQQIVNTGSTDVTLGVFTFQVGNGRTILKQIALQLLKISQEALLVNQQVTLWQGKNRVGSAIFFGRYATSTPLNIVLDPYTSVSITLKADIGNFDPVAGPITQLPANITIGYDGHNVGINGNYAVDSDSNELLSGSTADAWAYPVTITSGPDTPPSVSGATTTSMNSVVSQLSAVLDAVSRLLHSIQSSQ